MMNAMREKSAHVFYSGGLLMVILQGDPIMVVFLWTLLSDRCLWVGLTLTPHGSQIASTGR